MSELRHVLPLMIPIIAIVMGIGIGMLSMVLDYQKKLRLIEMNHKERLAALERGIELPPLPPEFFATTQRHGAAAKPHHNTLRWGLIWLFVGLGLATAMALNDGLEQASWALLPMAVGAAQLVYYAATRAQVQQAEDASSAPR